MNSQLPRIEDKPETEALVLNHDNERYPVQQIATEGKVTDEEVQDAVREMNVSEGLRERG